LLFVVIWGSGLARIFWHRLGNTMAAPNINSTFIKVAIISINVFNLVTDQFSYITEHFLYLAATKYLTTLKSTEGSTPFLSRRTARFFTVLLHCRPKTGLNEYSYDTTETFNINRIRSSVAKFLRPMPQIPVMKCYFTLNLWRTVWQTARSSRSWVPMLSHNKIFYQYFNSDPKNVPDWWQRPVTRGALDKIKFCPKKSSEVSQEIIINIRGAPC
jgi:hypothetical protein